MGIRVSICILFCCLFYDACHGVKRKYVCMSNGMGYGMGLWHSTLSAMTGNGKRILLEIRRK